VLQQTNAAYDRVKNQEPSTWLFIGESLNDLVPQLPLVRRWWNYSD
jgi:hypothetical protein